MHLNSDSSETRAKATWYSRVVLAVALACSGDVLSAQDTTSTRLPPITVTVTRDDARSVLELPFAVSQLSLDSTRKGARRGSLTELVLGVPGLAISNRHNPTQDPRLSVRGFGARSAFGIRGVRILRDGIPLTVADGQAAVDFVDLETVSSAEVMRGAAGALYGNASGGVVELRTQIPPGQSPIRARLRGTLNDDSERLSANLAGRSGSWGWQGTLTHTTGEGPRDYSRSRTTAFTGDVQKTFGGTLYRAQAIVFESPLADNPGAVTAAELATVPWVADSQNIRRRASKTVSHRQIGLSASRDWTRGSATASVYGSTRDLYNPQAFAIVGFDRRTMGFTGRVQQNGVIGENRWQLAIGGDLQSQRDDRRNWSNCAGLSGDQRPVESCPTQSDRGVENVHQLERVEAGGVFVRAELARDRFGITATLRGDQTNFTVRDRRESVGTPSVLSLSMGAFTPMAGVSFRPRPELAFYANVATSFETPTTTELANQPDGSAGINRDLKPQHGRTLEAGAKGEIAGRLRYDVALFNIATRNELIPFEIPNSGGRRYFRNAGKTERNGVEIGASALLGAIEVGASLTHLIYTYEEFTVGSQQLDGKRVPGVSPTTASLFATLSRRLGFITVEMQQASRTPVDDSNANYAAGHVLWSARAGLTALQGPFKNVQPVIGIENAFDRTYAANVVTNASRGRYFEPGAGRRVYVALSVGTGLP